jgi:hypothetical protein
VQLLEKAVITDSICIDLSSVIIATIIQGIKKGTDENLEEIAPLDFPPFKDIKKSIQTISDIENDYLAFLEVAQLTHLDLQKRKNMIRENLDGPEGSGILKRIWDKQDQSNSEKTIDCYRLMLLGLQFLLSSSCAQNIDLEANNELSIVIVETITEGIKINSKNILGMLPSESNKLNRSDTPPDSQPTYCRFR